MQTKQVLKSIIKGSGYGPLPAEEKNRTKQVFSIFLRTGMKFLAYIAEISLLPEIFGTPGITKTNLLVYFKHNLSPQQHK